MEGPQCKGGRHWGLTLVLSGKKLLEMDIADVFQPGSALDIPKRPPWDYRLSKEAVLAQEEKYFEAYVDSIHKTFTEDNLSYFEHNLEVHKYKIAKNESRIWMHVALHESIGSSTLPTAAFSPFSSKDMATAVAGARDL